uniref:Uncharacterized protein n=1 Tax=Rhodnius prolixus TaxID=13249 RepID=T1HVW5_RHOPR
MSGIRPIILKVIFLNTIQLLIYVGLAIVSFEDYPGYSPVCIHVRCADMFWLRDAGWRNDSSICDEEDKNFPNEIRPDPYDLVVNKSKHELNQLVDIGSRKASKTASITYVCLWCVFMLHKIGLLIIYWIELKYYKEDMSERVVTSEFVRRSSLIVR